MGTCDGCNYEHFRRHDRCKCVLASFLDLRSWRGNIAPATAMPTILDILAEQPYSRCSQTRELCGLTPRNGTIRSA